MGKQKAGRVGQVGERGSRWWGGSGGVVVGRGRHTGMQASI